MLSDYGYEPIILEKIPNLEDGDAQVSPVSVSAGTRLSIQAAMSCFSNTGTKVRPSGCRSDDCAINYDGSSTHPNGSTRRDLYNAQRADVV